MSYVKVCPKKDTACGGVPNEWCSDCPNWVMDTRESDTIKEKPMLHQAHDLINGQRQKDYGDKLTNFSQIAMMVNGVIATKLQVPLTAEDIALIMMCVKMARLAKSPDHYDSIVDIAGYAGCYERIVAERKNGTHIPGIISSIIS